MSDPRTHQTVSDDGTEIAGQVYGSGPSLILLPAGPGTSESSWRYMVPHLRDHLTCHLVDTRGRGRSGSASDLSPARLIEDISAYVRSIGEPAGVLGWGNDLVFRISAANAPGIAAAGVYEALAPEVLDAEEGARFGGMVARIAELVGSGHLDEAALVIVEDDVIYTHDEIAEGSGRRFWAEAAPLIPVFLTESQQAAESSVPSATDPSILKAITIPVLLMHGTKSKDHFIRSAPYLHSHIRDSTIREISGGVHFSPWTHPAEISNAVVRYFAPILSKL